MAPLICRYFAANIDRFVPRFFCGAVLRILLEEIVAQSGRKHRKNDIAAFQPAALDTR